MFSRVSWPSGLPSLFFKDVFLVFGRGGPLRPHAGFLLLWRTGAPLGCRDSHSGSSRRRAWALSVWASGAAA